METHSEKPISDTLFHFYLIENKQTVGKTGNHGRALLTLFPPQNPLSFPPSHNPPVNSPLLQIHPHISASRNKPQPVACGLSPVTCIHLIENIKTAPPVPSENHFRYLWMEFCGFGPEWL